MIYAELTQGTRDLLRAAYDAGFSAGSGRPWLLSDDAELLSLIDAITDDWFVSLELAQDARPVWPDEAPTWLRAHAERQVLPVRETAPLGAGRDL